MYRSIAAGIALLLPAIAALPGQKPRHQTASRLGEVVGRRQLGQSLRAIHAGQRRLDDS